MIRLQGFRTINLGYVKNPRWRPLLKIAKPSKSTFSPEPLDIIGYKGQGSRRVKIGPVTKINEIWKYCMCMSVVTENDSFLKSGVLFKHL